MTTGPLRFQEFRLDPGERRLTRDGETVELNGRYFDALALMASEPGTLISKTRFMDEVWRGVPVTDEALTQCITALRRQLGDSAARPRFIETVPRHGYRFIAPVERGEATAATASASAPPVGSSSERLKTLLTLGGAGTVGAGAAGLIGGLAYGFAGVGRGGGEGGASALIVLVVVTVAMALLGGAGVSFGIAAARLAPRRPGPWIAVGGAGGGLIVGAFVKLLGLDAFNLLFGRSPEAMTGAFEGAVLGGAVGLAAWVAGGMSVRRGAAAAGAIGAVAGVVIPLLGGRLMGGSLDLLATSFPGSRLKLGQMGGLFGETGFGPVTQAVTGGVEGLLFAACIVVAMTLAGRRAQGPTR